MSYVLNDREPIFIQIKEKIEDQIVSRYLEEHDQIPSTTQMVSFYKVNHITVSKGITQLVDEKILYKKRGVGMFVAGGARDRLLRRRREQFINKFLRPMIQEADKLGFTKDEVGELIRKLKESEDK